MFLTIRTLISSLVPGDWQRPSLGLMILDTVQTDETYLSSYAWSEGDSGREALTNFLENFPLRFLAEKSRR